MRLCVYTAITGGYDPLFEQPFAAGVDYVCYADVPGIYAGRNDWRFRDCEPGQVGARIVKTSFRPFHETECDYCLWIDGSYRLTVSPSALLDHYNHDAVDLWVFRHPQRSSVDHEVTACAALKKAKARLLEKHVKARTPKPDDKLYATGVMIARRSDRLLAMGARWADDMREFSARDQISLPWLIKEFGIRVGILQGSPWQCPFAEYYKHPNRAKLGSKRR